MSDQFYQPAPGDLVACDDGQHFILLEKANAHCNWVMRRHPDGGLVSVRKATHHELAHARARQHLRAGVVLVREADPSATVLAAKNPAAEGLPSPVMKLEAEKLLGRDGEYAVSFERAGWLEQCRVKGGTFPLYSGEEVAALVTALTQERDTALSWQETVRDSSLLVAQCDAALAREAALQQLLNEKDQRLDAIGEWAIGRWHAEVANRPLANVHRRSLDDTWRQIIRHLGIDDVAVCGLAHDDLLALYARGVRPDDTCAHSHGNKLGCPECGEKFNGDEVKP